MLDLLNNLNPYFSTFPLSESSLDFIKQKIVFISVKSNQLLITPGEVCDSVFLVVQGGFVCRYIHEEYEIAKTINFYLADIHPFMACVDSYFNQTPTQCELRAIADSWVIKLNKKHLDELRIRDSQVDLFYNSVVITALTEENELKLKLIAYSSEQLYEYLITTFPSIIQKVPAKYIAEFMGISAEWLSKLKRNKK